MTVYTFTDGRDVFVQQPGTSCLNDEFFFLAGSDRLVLTRGDDLAGLGRTGQADMGEGDDIVITGFNTNGLFYLGNGNDFFFTESDFGQLGGTIRVFGGSGNDLLWLQSAESGYFGDEGQDVFVSPGKNNFIDGGSASDWLSLELADKSTTIDMGDDNQAEKAAGRAYGSFQRSGDLFKNIENIRGSRFRDSIYGDENNNIIEGLGGDDEIYANGGDDIVSGGLGINKLYGGLGFNTIVIEGNITAVYDLGNEPGFLPGDFAVEGTLNGEIFQHYAQDFQQVLRNGILQSAGSFLGRQDDNRTRALPALGILGTNLFDIANGLRDEQAVGQAVVALTVSPASVAEDGLANLVFTFSRTGPTTSALTVNYGISGTADANDYTGATPGTAKTITFAAGSATATVTVDPSTDSTIEANETVAFTLAAGTGYSIGTTTAVAGTISNDDALPSVTLAVSPASVTEDGTANLIYTFTRTGPTTSALSVNYSVSGSALQGTDYTGITAWTVDNPIKSITIAAGSATATVAVDPIADSSIEANETVAFTLAAGTGYSIGTTTAVTGTITNDDALPSVTLAVSPASVTEDGTANLIYTFTRTGPTTSALSVNYSVSGSALQGTDYTGITAWTVDNPIKSITIAAGSATATVAVDPIADSSIEANETVAFTLAAGTGYSIGTTTAVTGTITNDDALPSVTLAVSPASVTEDGTANLIYTFTRNGAVSGALTVNYTVGGTARLAGTPTDPADYRFLGSASTATSRTVTFAAGSSTATVTVDPTADSIIEVDETIALTLAAGSGYSIGTTAAMVGIIRDDDTALTSTDLTYFLAIDGVNGGSTDRLHEGAFEIQGFEFELLRENGALSKGGPTFSPLTINLNANPGLTALLRNATVGGSISSVRLEGVVRKTDGVPPTIYDLRLGDVSISKFRDSSGYDQLSFYYRKISLATKELLSNGALSAGSTFSWDRELNRETTIAAPNPSPSPSQTLQLLPTDLTYFLTIDGVNGGSTDRLHEGAFEIQGFEFELLRENGALSKGGPTFSPLTINLNANPGLTALLRKATVGGSISSVRLEGVVRKTDGVPPTIYDLRLGDVSISKFRDSSGYDQLSFDYRKISLATKELLSNGALSAGSTFSWDRELNRETTIAAPNPSPSPSQTLQLLPTDLTYFLTIDGVNGGSTDRLHEGAFEIQGFEFELLRENGALSKGGPTFSPLTINLNANPGLTALLRKATVGGSISSVRLEGVVRKTDGVPPTIYDLRLGDVSISKFRDSSGYDQLSFDYRKISLATKELLSNGALSAGSTFSWDRELNRETTIAAPNPSPSPSQTLQLLPTDLTYFLTIDGVNGGSTDRLHEGAFEIQGFEFELLRENGALSKGGPTFSPLTINLNANPGLTALLRKATVGGSISSVRLEGVVRKTDGVPPTIYDLRLGDISISKFRDSSGYDQLSFDYRKISLATKELLSNGALSAGSTFSWDRELNRETTIAAPNPSPSPSQTLQLLPTDLTYFLTIDGVNGGSTDRLHEGAFEIQGFEFELLRENGALSKGGPTFSPLTINLNANPGLTALLRKATVGGSISSVRLEGVVRRTDGVPPTIYDLRLGDVSISKFRDSSGYDQLSFDYRKISLATKELLSNGALSASSTFSWDRELNRETTIAAPNPSPSPSQTLQLLPTDLTYFLTIDGVNGGSTDRLHEGAFEIRGFEFELLRENGALSKGGPTFSPLTINLNANPGLTALLRKATVGESISSVRLEGVVRKTDGVPPTIYDLRLGDVSISKFRDSSGYDQLSFDYRKISLATKELLSNGALSAGSTFSWDRDRSASINNNAPTGLTVSAISFQENIPAGTVVATLASSDLDAGDTFTYSLVPGTGAYDNAAFSIVGDELKIMAVPDYESKSSYSILVRTTDQGGLSFDRAVTFSVADLDEAPVAAAIITLAVSPASVTEDGSANLIYTFTRTGPTSNALSINYTAAGTATLGTDYTGIAASPATKTIAFAVGSATTFVTVNPTADTTIEAAETVALTLAAGSGYTAGTTTAVVGTITNDDFPIITLAVSPASVTEDRSANLIYTFSRTGPTTSALTVNYTAAGTATLGTDYTGIATTGTTKTVTFAAGSATATVTVDPTADTTIEANETVALTLAAGSGYTVGTTAAVVGTIRNDDVQSSVSTTLTGDQSTLALIGTRPVNAAGNELNNIIIGNASNNRIIGGLGKDTLTGGGLTDNDTFVFNALNESLLSGFDVITDFTRRDLIDAPFSVGTTTLRTSLGNAASLTQAAIAAVLTSTRFVANRATVFTATGYAGTFLAFNDSSAGFQSATDSIIFLQGFTFSSTNNVVLV